MNKTDKLVRLPDGKLAHIDCIGNEPHVPANITTLKQKVSSRLSVVTKKDNLEKKHLAITR